ncbi:Uncharacterised protein [Escherichia coli]|nr:Uncharacterised protein [Escherichia coli]
MARCVRAVLSCLRVNHECHLHKPVDQRKSGFTVCASPCLRQGKKLEQTEFSLQHHRTAPAFFRYRIQPEPGICRFRAVVFAVGLYGLLVLTFNIVISGHISALRRKAASIQEMYDCRVLGIRRNELKVEEIPRDDIIREAAYFRDSPEKARKRFGEEGWYVSKVYDAPQAVMALLCHGKNLGWDKSLREVLHVFYLSAFIVSPVAMLVYGIVMKSGLNEILFYVVFTLPVIRYFLLQFLDNRSSMKRSEKLKKYVEKELSGIRVSGRAEEEQLGYTLRNIQDEMFAYRASCPPVPNGIQLIRKPKNERIYVDYFETNLKEMHLQK